MFGETPLPCGITGVSPLRLDARFDSGYDVTWRLAGTTTHLAVRHLPLTLAGPTGSHHPHPDEHDDSVGREEPRRLHHCLTHYLPIMHTRSACVRRNSLQRRTHRRTD